MNAIRWSLRRVADSLVPSPTRRAAEIAWGEGRVRGTFLSVARLSPWLVALLIATPSAWAQVLRNDPHIGYVYPAGGRVDTSVQVTVGGQYLDGVTGVYVSGNGVQGAVTKHRKPLAQREVNKLREKMKQAREKAQAERKDDKTKNVQEVITKLLREMGVSDEKLEAYETYQKQRTDPKRQLNPQLSETVTIEIKLAPDAELGERDLRLKTPVGLSNPLRFHVRNLPEYSETEPNDETADAGIQDSLPVIVNGQILPGDVDRFQFAAQKGERLVMIANARELIPYLADAVPGWFQATLALYDAEGQEVAYVDDYRYHPDPILYYQIPKDGQYTLEVKDAIYRGREDFVYRITLGELPYVRSVFPLGGRMGETASVEVKGWNLRVRNLRLDSEDRGPGVHRISVSGDRRVPNHVLFAVDTIPECLEEEPNNEHQNAQQVRPPLIINGRIDHAGDWDVFCFRGRAGGRVTVDVQARRLNSPLDSLLKLTDESGRPLAVSDDCEDKGEGLITHHADSRLLFQLPENGVYYVHLGDTQNQGGSDYGYRLRIGARRPDFELRAVPSSINVPANGTVPMTVYALRRDDFAGDIWLSLKDASPGFVLSGAWVPANLDKVTLTLTVPPTDRKEPVYLHMEGRATVRGQELCRPVVPADDMVQAFIYHHLVPAKDFVVSASGSPQGDKPAPWRNARRGPAHRTTFDDKPVQIPTGGTVELQLSTTGVRSVRQAQLELNEPPEGITMQRLFSGQKSFAIMLHADAEKVRPGLKGNLIVQAVAGGAGARRRLLGTLPAIPFEVVQSDEVSP